MLRIFADGSADDRVAFVTRWFGWSMLAILVAWLVNTIANLSYGWPGVAGFFEGQGGLAGAVQFALYPLAIGLAAGCVYCAPHRTLRQEAAAISDFNIYLVRGAFFAVLFVGLADSVVSFLRIEEMLVGLVGDDMTRNLGRATWRGLYIHVPLIALGFVVAFFARTIGFHWLALLIVIAELAIVITRFIFSYEQAFMGDLVRFWYAALFLFASAYTLLDDTHVRVDVFYAALRNRVKGMFNTTGTLLFGITLCWVILAYGLGNKSAVVWSPLVNFEVSQSVFGLYVKYLMAGFLGVFAITMLIQFTSYLLESVADWRDEPGTRLGQSAPAH